MQINQGKFMANGRCGYVLKPAYMLDPSFDPQQGTKVSEMGLILISLKFFTP